MNDQNQKKRFLGIDVGRKYIGIAVSDDEGRIAFPREVVSAQEAIHCIITIAQQESIRDVVIGEPHELDGSASAHASVSHTFAKELKSEALAHGIDITCVFVDERFSTAHVSFGDTKSLAAHKKDRRQQGTTGERKDAQAAAVILQRYLDTR